MRKTLWTREYIWAIFVLLCVHMGPYLLLSVITVYGKMLSGSDALAGMMASVFALSGLFARFLSAILLDRLPVKKVLYIFTALMGAASFLYIFTSQYWQAFVLRGIQGLAYGITCTAMSTYIVRLLDPENRLEGIGYSSLTANLANAIGPAAAYALLGEEVSHFRALFIAVFISVVISFITMLFLRDQNQEAVSRKTENAEEMTSPGVIILPFILWAFMSLAMSVVAAFLSLMAIQKGFGSIGLYFTLNVIGVVASRVIMKKMTAALGENPMIRLMIFMIAACLAGIALCTKVWQLYIIAVPFGFANGCLAPLINTQLVNSLPDSRSGLANAVFFAAGDAGFILGPTFWGFVSGLTSYVTVFLAAAGICLFAMILHLFFVRNKRGAAA